MSQVQRANRGDDGPSIFLSYAHVDNQPELPNESDSGWVDYFQDCLRRQLDRLGRLDVRFWRDVAEIPGAERFTPLIIDGLNRCDVFLPIVSPTYLTREWCTEEIRRFAARAEHEPALDRRIIPVHKLPVDEVLLPKSLKGREGYPFYRHDRNKNAVVEFFRRGEEQDPTRYGNVVDKIAVYLCSVLPHAAPVAPRPNPAAADARLTVFVADPAPDMYAAYGRITDELKSRGFRVVTDPEEDWVLDPAAFDASVSAALAEAKVVVHVLGKNPGPRVGTARLVDAGLAATHKQPTPRIIWAPTTLLDDPTRPDGVIRIDGRDPLSVLKDFGDFREGDVVAGDPFEKFLQDLIRRCEGLKPAVSRKPPRQSDQMVRVYVVGAEEDGAVVDDVTALLIDDHGLAANASTYEGAPELIRRLHEDEMREADAILYCWGLSSDTWVRLYAREGRDVGRFGRQQPYRATALLPVPPIEGRRKKSFRTADISMHLAPVQAVTSDVLAPFVEAIL